MGVEKPSEREHFLRFDATRAGAIDAFLATGDAERLCRALSDGIDTLIRATFLRHSALASQVALFATGGYGRRALAPFSDIDVMFIVDEGRSAQALSGLFEAFLSPLWEHGFRIGYSVHSVSSALRTALDESVFYTSLLDARYVCGCDALGAHFGRSFEPSDLQAHTAWFVQSKLDERDVRLARFGQNRQMREPHIKCGKGMLRDVHFAQWIARQLFGKNDLTLLAREGVFSAHEAARFEQAAAFLNAVRCHLHLIMEREHDHLSFAAQQDIAQRFGFENLGGLKDVERFMKLVFHASAEISRLVNLVCVDLEMRGLKVPPRLNRLSDRSVMDRVPQAHQGRFALMRGRLRFVQRSEQLSLNDVLGMYVLADEMNVVLHPKALQDIDAVLRRVSRDDLLSAEALRSLGHIIMHAQDPEVLLSDLNEVGVLSRMIPQFRRVRGLIPFNSYHDLSVDMHLLATVGAVADMEDQSFKLGQDRALFQSVVGAFDRFDVLRLAALLHDIGKGRMREHSVLGAEIATRVLRLFNIAPEDSFLVRWLVRHHHLMSDSAFQRDLGDPKTIYDFVRQVGDFDRLKALYLLTLADIFAVGRDVLSSWKFDLLDQLFVSSKEIFEDGFDALLGREETHARQEMFQTALRESGVSAEQCQRFLDRVPASYLVRARVEHAWQHVQVFQAAHESHCGVSVRFFADEEAQILRVVVVSPDRPQVLSTIAETLIGYDLPVIEAVLHSTRDGLVIDDFSLSASHLSLSDDYRRVGTRLCEALCQVLETFAPRSRLPKRRRSAQALAFSFVPKVFVSNTLSDHYSVIEVRVPDYAGLLSDLAFHMARLDVFVASAQIMTYGAEAVDVFYVVKTDGSRLSDVDDIPRIRRSLQRFIKARLV